MIKINTTAGTKLLFTENLLYIESSLDGAKSIAHFNNGTYLKISETLNDIEKKLESQKEAKFDIQFQNPQVLNENVSEIPGYMPKAIKNALKSKV